MELRLFPNILVVRLKWSECDKLETLVNFPLNGLDMGTHCARHGNGQESFVEDSVPAMYDLLAVANHYGRMGFGHYTAFAANWNENETSNEWQLFDDSTVRVWEDQVIPSCLRPPTCSFIDVGCGTRKIPFTAFPFLVISALVGMFL